MAVAEDVRILGINDFYVTDGYHDFVDKCLDHALFPLLNIELIGISKTDQEQGIRVNDPGNPGRTYISGKGLAIPVNLPLHQQEKLDRVIKESNRQVSRMIKLLNEWFHSHQVAIRLTVDEIMEQHAMKLLRERHVAKAIRLKLEEVSENDAAYFDLLKQVYGGKPSEKQKKDIAGVEDELRDRLLKSGAPAFVPEDEKAFLPLEEIVQIIKDAGGIPTYPLLLDGSGGQITDFEDGKEQLLEELTLRGFHSIEFIPSRNQFDILKEYATYFYDHGFVVSFGTEHNTTALDPITVSCMGMVPLDDQLMQISYNGAAYTAAHQYKAAREGKGYIPGTRDEMEKLGHSIFQYYFNTFSPALLRKKLSIQ